MHEVKVPEIGKVEEINIVSWKVNEGARVTKGMEVAEIETMKSTFSVESPVDGVVDEIFVKPGEKVQVDQALASIKSN